MLGYLFMQGEIDAYRTVGKMNAAVIGAIEHAGIEERMHVAMDPLHVATDAPSYLAKSHGILPGHRLEHFPAFFRQGLPEQLDRAERNMRPLLLSLKSRPGAPAYIVTRSDR